VKDLTINLNASNASGEAYWRKRCDTVEAELTRLRAELSRADVALSEAPFHGQEELAEASLADGIRNYRNAVESELSRLRAALESLDQVLCAYHGITDLAQARMVMEQALGIHEQRTEERRKHPHDPT
jgi:hypothetical protein